MTDLDGLLKASLTADAEPDPMLNRRIVMQAERKKTMRKTTRFAVRKMAVAGIAACVIAASSVTAFAAYNFLNPGQVVTEVTGNERLAAAFDSPDAVAVDQTQRVGDYSVTLLGMVTGEELGDALATADDADKQGTSQIDPSHTYVTVAVTHVDGTPMADADEPLNLSPLVNGVDWHLLNLGTMGAVLSSMEVDGTLYELLECDDLQVFANQGVKLGVGGGFGDEGTLYTCDAQTGQWSKAAPQDTDCALFDLPFDASKADPQAAQELLDALQGKVDGTVGTDEERAQKGSGKQVDETTAYRTHGKDTFSMYKEHGEK